MLYIKCANVKCADNLVFGPHAALAKKPEMLMYNMYTPLSELSAALPADQIHHSDPPPAF